MPEVDYGVMLSSSEASAFDESEEPDASARRQDDTLIVARVNDNDVTST
jgi:hypothetical protein